jgi:hypothetical protein
MGRKVALMMGISLLLALPAAARGAVLHDQTNSPGHDSYTSEAFPPPQDTADGKLADDFTVPAGQTWSLSQVDVIGEDDPYMGMSPPPFVNVFLYDASSSPAPGAERFHASHVPVSNYPNDAVPITGAPALGPGTHWIVVQEDGGEFMVPSWGWKGRTIQDGNQATFQGGSFWGPTCSTFQPIKTCFPSGDGVDLLWKISGSANSEPVAFGKLKRLPNGTAKLTVNLPAPGTLALGGKGIKGSSAQVATGDARSVTLKIRSTGKAKRTLDASGKVTVKAGITYTAAGASPSTTKKKIKLTKR